MQGTVILTRDFVIARSCGKLESLLYFCKKKCVKISVLSGLFCDLTRQLFRGTTRKLATHICSCVKNQMNGRNLRSKKFRRDLISDLMVLSLQEATAHSDLCVYAITRSYSYICVENFIRIFLCGKVDVYKKISLL